MHTNPQQLNDIPEYNPSTQTLNLNSNPSWFKILSQSQSQSHPLKTLQLSNNSISYHQLPTLPQKTFKKIKVLDLSQNCLTYVGVKDIFGAFQGGDLEEIILYRNNLGDAGGRVVLGLGLGKLREIWLGENNMTYRALAGIKECRFVNLEILDLDNNMIGTTGIKQLCKANFAKLQRLHLQNTNLTSTSILHLSKSPSKNLLQLGLTTNTLQSSSLQSLTYTNWPLLQFLNINDNEIGEICLMEIVGLEGRLGESGFCYQRNLRRRGQFGGFEGIGGVVFRVVVDKFGR